MPKARFVAWMVPVGMLVLGVGAASGQTYPVKPMVKSGRLLARGVTTTYRAQALPDVPTIAEAGLTGFEYQGWYGMLAPGKTPRKIVNLLNAEVGHVLDLPETRERIANQGAAARRSTPAAFDQLVRDEITTRTRVWKAAGVKVE